jgi:hypothetical protein
MIRSTLSSARKAFRFGMALRFAHLLRKAGAPDAANAAAVLAALSNVGFVGYYTFDSLSFLAQLKLVEREVQPTAATASKWWTLALVAALAGDALALHELNARVAQAQAALRAAKRAAADAAAIVTLGGGAVDETMGDPAMMAAAGASPAPGAAAAGAAGPRAAAAGGTGATAVTGRGAAPAAAADSTSGAAAAAATAPSPAAQVEAARAQVAQARAALVSRWLEVAKNGGNLVASLEISGWSKSLPLGLLVGRGSGEGFGDGVAGAGGLVAALVALYKLWPAPPATAATPAKSIK